MLSTNEGKVFESNELSKLSSITNNEISETVLKEMVEMSIKAKQNSYSPYSKFRVGCSLLSQDGKITMGKIFFIFLGTNVENVSFSVTICAERSAICGAVSNGINQFLAVLVSSDMDYFLTPCGTCRQALAEVKVKYCILMTNDCRLQLYSTEHLLPLGCAIPSIKK